MRSKIFLTLLGVLLIAFGTIVLIPARDSVANKRDVFVTLTHQPRISYASGYLQEQKFLRFVYVR